MLSKNVCTALCLLFVILPPTKNLFTFPSQTDINDCAPNPCEGVGSSCTDLVNDFTCTCQAGLTGKSCQVSFFFDHFKQLTSD